MADREALTRGSTRGWSAWQVPTTYGLGAWAWNAWCDGESRTGTSGSEVSARALAQAALDELVNEARQRSLRGV